MPCQMTSLVPSWDWDSHRVTESHWGAYGSCQSISISGLPSPSIVLGLSGSADAVAIASFPKGYITTAYAV